MSASWSSGASCRLADDNDADLTVFIGELGGQHFAEEACQRNIARSSDDDVCDTPLGSKAEELVAKVVGAKLDGFGAEVCGESLRALQGGRLVRF